MMKRSDSLLQFAVLLANLDNEHLILLEENVPMAFVNLLLGALQQSNVENVV